MVVFIAWLEALPAGRYRFWSESENWGTIWKVRYEKWSLFFSRSPRWHNVAFTLLSGLEIEVKDARDLGRSLFFHFPDFLKILENFPVQTLVWIGELCTNIFTSLFFCILWHLGWLHSAGGCVWGRWLCVQASQTSAATRTPARTASICRNLLWSSPPDVFKVHNCGRLCAPVRQVFSCLPPPTAPAAPGHQKIAHLNPPFDAFLCEGE